MKLVGPPLHDLLLRVRSVLPEAFSDEADLSAVIHDFFRDHNLLQAEDTETIGRFSKDEKNFVVMAIWLYGDPAFKRFSLSSSHGFFQFEAENYARFLQPRVIQDDPLRAEEFVRLCLNRVGLIPAGETEVTADDRLQTLDSVAAEDLEIHMKAERERAKAVRKEIQRASARAAAAKVSRE